jgi:TetR/AcrR family transcriptional regulator, transcriptional repressor for nem operon
MLQPTTTSARATRPTRGKLVEAARRLFWERGYEATSLQDVVDRARVKSGSLYYFFRTKEDLLLAVLDHYVDLLWPAVIEPAFGRTADPIERIFSILNGYREGLVYTGFTHGCPIGNLALEVSDDYPRAREKIAQNFAGWRKWIRRCLEDAADRLPAGTDSERMSMFVLSLMEGAVMQARAHHSLEPFDASVVELRQYFKRLLDEGARERAPKVH